MIRKVLPQYDYVPDAEGFVVRANQSPLKTPADKILILPTQALTETIVEEWQAQAEKIKGEKINADTMPLTQLAMTALDRVDGKIETVIAGLVTAAETDLLWHHAEEPPELIERQNQIWNPWIEWLEKTHGAKFSIGKGVIPIKQSNESLERLRKAITAYDAFHLAGLQQVVAVTGSFVLGLALMAGNASPETVFTASELETLFQVEKWGEDPVTTARHESLKRELDICAQWFRLLK